MPVAVDFSPSPGELVRVRSRRYLVESVDPAPRPEDQTLVRLSCLEDDAEGEELEVLWEKELDAERISAADWTRLAQGNFDDPRQFGAYYHTLRWNSVTSTDPQLFQAPYRAGIRIDAYQLEPLRKALLLPRVNLFIADDVGLGKTIEAGLIVRELLMRQRVRRIVVAAPPSVLLQWKEELDQRFGLTFVVFDRDYVRRMRQERGFAVNPWTTHSRFIVSHHLLRDEDYASPLRDWLDRAGAGSLLILDEAHNAAPASGAIRDAEIETLMSSEEIGQDHSGSNFYAQVVTGAGAAGPMRHVSRVVKVHRLREVIAQVGFTRFEAAVPDVNGELELGVERADLSLDQTWLPAIENRGEGVFIGIRAESVEEWLQRDAVQARAAQLRRGFDAWAASHSAGANATFVGVPYVMLHTLAHLLITAVSLDCGYAASSIRERVYAVPAGFGILLYTSSPDAQGTLGGLVETADRMPAYLERALALGELCSNDPVCAQHRPDSPEEDRFLLGAACHGCLLLPESSCERRNDYLDRALIVPTVDGDGAAFFEGD